LLASHAAAEASSNSDAGFPNPDAYQYLGGESSVSALNFSISATLGDHMVLQRAPASAVVWGFAAPGTEVVATFNGKKFTATTDAGTGVWRVRLEPTAAGGPYAITFSASTGETASLSDVLFGDVYICGGQSNMQFSVGGNENAAAYAKEASNYPNIRLFTVGQGTSSKGVKLMDLKTIEQKWVAAGPKSVTDGSAFNYFSAVCWFFGKGVYDGLDAKVPVGLVSNNWGGTRVEQWMSPATSLPCGHASSGELYNAMIVPYTVGPMAVTGFTWYQGESDLSGSSPTPAENQNYTCTQAAQIEQWRREFQAPDAFYSIVQLSTWFADPTLLAELRDQQLASGDLIPNFAYATNADHGAGGNIHPPYKQHPGARLANAALSIVYNQPINWRSPTYASAVATGLGEVTVWLNDVLDAGLVLKAPANAKTAGNCTALNAKAPRTCAWAELQFNDPASTWVNATVAVGADKKTMVLKATPPASATEIVASSYGWGAVPMMTVYRADMDGEDGQLPVLTWNRPLVPPTMRSDAGLTLVV
jgi:sialate O-acetylesterase